MGVGGRRAVGGFGEPKAKHPAFSGVFREHVPPLVAAEPKLPLGREGEGVGLEGL